MICYIETGMNFMVLIVDDDADLRHLVRTYVENDGMRCDEADTGDIALEKIEQAPYDIIVLDIMMPGKDGLSVLSEIRALKSPAASTPVIMLTARKEEHDKLLGFKMGADDYVSKPFSPAELMARIKAVLRRGPSIVDDCLHFNSLEIKVKERLVIIDGKEIQLRPKEFDLLSFLARNNNMVLSREQLFKTVWDYNYYGDLRTVDTHIKSLRERLLHCRDYIVTVWGVGYKFDFKA
jgi:DNA-binding response OmpR family regulator